MFISVAESAELELLSWMEDVAGEAVFFGLVFGIDGIEAKWDCSAPVATGLTELDGIGDTDFARGLGL